MGFPLGQELATDFILASLPPSYRNFVSNYHMHGAEKGLNELCGMLKTAESDIKKSTCGGHVMAVQNKPTFKKKGSSWKKKKKKGKAKVANPKPNPTSKTKTWTSCRQGVLSLSPARTLEEELQAVPSHTEESFFHIGYAYCSYYRNISR